MSSRPVVVIVGAGRAGSSLGFGLRNAGVTVEGPLRREDGLDAISTRDVVDVVILAVRDDGIAETSRRLADARASWAGVSALHLSGLLGASELAALRDAGATVASWHPLASLEPSSFPRDVTFFAEGDAAALDVARVLSARLGATVREIGGDSKGLYHAAAAMAGNLAPALLLVASRLMVQAGASATVDDASRLLGVLASQGMERVVAVPHAASLTGPVARGDADTVAAHLEALRTVPAARRAVLALVAMMIEELGLPAGDSARERMAALLAEWERSES